MRRAGHTTSAMVSRYAKHFENAAELKLGRLRALDRVIPELAEVAARQWLGGSRSQVASGADEFIARAERWPKWRNGRRGGFKIRYP